MKIGILGGSFDPIHNGHMHMAQSALSAYSLDELWLIPAGHSPNKDEKQMTPAEDRLEMTRLAAVRAMQEKPEFTGRLIASDFEIVSPERSYTYRTLEKLHASHPDDDFYFIMGADSLDYFDRWYHPEIISQLATILVVVREGFPTDAMEKKILEIQALFPCTICLVPCRQYDISSSKIRSNIADEDLCRSVLAPEVYDYIRNNRLYGL